MATELVLFSTLPHINFALSSISCRRNIHMHIRIYKFKKNMQQSKLLAVFNIHNFLFKLLLPVIIIIIITDNKAYS